MITIPIHKSIINYEPLIVESVDYDKPRLERVKKRKSYTYWAKFREFLENNPSDGEIMVYVHGLLRNMRAFKYNWRDYSSLESLNLLLMEDSLNKKKKTLVGGKLKNG